MSDLTVDPAYNTITRDAFPMLLDASRYAGRSPHFDEIIARTEEHFWNPADPDYIDFGTPWSADEPLLPLGFIPELQSAVVDKLDDGQRVAFANAPSDYAYASELVVDIRERGNFSIGVAAHPEVHPRSPDRETDRRWLAEKLRIADFAVTQFFFEVEHYVRLVEELDALGVSKPVLPGIMPITNKGLIARMAQMSGTAVPTWLTERLDATDDPHELRKIAVDAATELCLELLANGAPGLHFYTLNRSTATREIYSNIVRAQTPVTGGRFSPRR